MAMDDNDTSYKLRNGDIDIYTGISDISNEISLSRVNSQDKYSDIPVTKSIYHGANLFAPEELKYGIFNNRYRFGFLNAYQSLTACREYLFFVKPDLNIFNNSSTNARNTSDGRSTSKTQTGNVPLAGLNDALQMYPYWSDLYERYPDVLKCLQSSYPVDGTPDPFNHLLENTVQSNLDVPGISTRSDVETPQNVYGVGYTYRGSSEASDDTFDFSLEFKDTKYLPVYHFFKAYELYETLKHHGVIGPRSEYILNKVLHDQYAIYKFLVDEDGETIVYYAKYYGVKSRNLPRDVFNQVNFDNGVSYSIDFNAAFVEDMDPQILTDFNALSYDFWRSRKYHIDIYNDELDRADMRPAQSAIVVKESADQVGFTIPGITNKLQKPINAGDTPHSFVNVPGRTVYKLKWKGDAVV